MTITLTTEWTKQQLARAVPGSEWNPESRAWELDEPTPRAATVALRLFPHLGHEHPELLEARDSLIKDARPTDYASQLGLRISAPRVEKELAKRGITLHEEQVVDLGYAEAVLRKHAGFYLGWARGKGKTIGTCCLIDVLDPQATLVVAPNTAKQSVWSEELEMSCPWAEVIVLPNEKAARERTLKQVQHKYSLGETFILVLHYEALAVIAGGKGKEGKTLGDGWKKLGITWDLMTMDEGHRLANPDAKMSKAAKKVPADRRLIMSGSVFQNKWEELFSPLQFLFPKQYTSRWRDWNDRFLDYIESGWGKVCVGVKEHKTKELQDELGVFMVYRDKVNLAVPNTVLVDLSEEQRRVYDELTETCMAQLEDGTIAKAEMGVAMLSKLRQVATGLDLLTAEIADSSKLDAAVQCVLDNPDDEFVTFVWYKATAWALAARLQEHGIESFVVTGDVKQKDRTQMIRDFQSGERKVFIGTIPTLGESVNLQRANHVIRIDRSWNPALNQQAVDRVDRQGQKRSVTLTDIIARNTVDELVVLPNLANKEALKAAILGA